MDPLSVPVGTGLPDPKAAEALAARAESLSETLDKLIANLNHASAEARERITAEKSGVVTSIGGAADRATIADAGPVLLAEPGREPPPAGKPGHRGGLSRG